MTDSVAELPFCKLVIDPLDDTVSKQISDNKIWEPQSTQIVKDNVKKGDIFIDVGAMIGYYSFLAASLVGEEGHVFAFEPSHRSASFIMESIRLNDVYNITVLNMALLDKQKWVTMWRDKTAVTNRGGCSRLGDLNVGGWVFTSTLDAVLNGIKPDFIKTDCQGTDYLVLLGATKTLIDSSPKLLVETESHGDKIHKYLEGLGYTMQTAIPKEATEYWIKNV